MFKYYPTNTSRVFYNKTSFPRRFKVEYTWCVFRVIADKFLNLVRNLLPFTFKLYIKTKIFIGR